MIIFIYGQDSYRSRQKLNEIIDQNQKAHKSGLNLRVIDCPNSDFQDFKNALETISMFESKKMIILKNAFSSPAFEKPIDEYKERMLGGQDNIVFYEDGKADSRKSLFKFLKKKSSAQEFELLTGGNLRNWIGEEFKKYGLEIGSKVSDLLILYCGSDTWRIANEAKKIAANKSGGTGKKEALEEDIKSLVKGDLEIDIFKTIEAISAKNKKLALRYLHSLLEKGDSSIYLLSMISYQFRNLLLIKDLTERKTQYQMLAKKSGLHPFVVKKSWEACRPFSLLELKEIYRKIFQADLDVKTGKIDPETALDLLLVSV
ncbi:MAG: DNA polymerase III subunit delta [bacterium]|nr:DNA polymerase III subunit delta [bacterium]